jgi:hypothetical protein
MCHELLCVSLAFVIPDTKKDIQPGIYMMKREREISKYIYCPYFLYRKKQMLTNITFGSIEILSLRLQWFFASVNKINK